MLFLIYVLFLFYMRIVLFVNSHSGVTWGGNLVILVRQKKRHAMSMGMDLDAWGQKLRCR